MPILNLKEATRGLSDEEIGGVVTMATNLYFNQRLNEALGEYAEFGFQFKKTQYNQVDLYFKDKKLATYDAEKATIDVVREHCKNYLKSLVRSLD